METTRSTLSSRGETAGLWPLKLANTVTDRDVRHLQWFTQRMGNSLLDAIIINTGPNAYRRSDGVGVVPLGLLAP